MDPFRGKNPFENMGHMQQNPFSSDYFDQVKEMMDQVNSTFNEEFWNNINSMGKQKKQNKVTGFPVEMWESDKELFVLAHIPGVKDTRQVKVNFLTEKKINIKAKLQAEQPPTAKRQLATEFSDLVLQREVTMPYEVKSDNYNVHVGGGVTTIIFGKADPSVKVPFDF